jgi:hypothetical protein
LDHLGIIDAAEFRVLTKTIHRHQYRLNRSNGTASGLYSAASWCSFIGQTEAAVEFAQRGVALATDAGTRSKRTPQS